MKKITFEGDARKKLLEGVEIMYKAVATTLGPKGRNVAIGRPWGYPLVLHDGVSVAKEIESEDEWVEIGVRLIKQAASKTNIEAGDGTTTATLLAYHLVVKGMALLEKGINPMVLRKELEATLPILKERLKKILKEIPKNNKDLTELKRVAFVSSASEEIGNLVAEAVDKNGQEGTVAVEDSQTPETYVQYTEGFLIDKPYLAPHFVTNPDRMEAIVEQPLIAILGKKITMVREIVPLLEVMLSQSKNCFIIGEVSGDALTSAVVNRVKGIGSILVVEPPGMKQDQEEILTDIAAITGATVVKDELGLDTQQFAAQFDKNWLGKAESVVSSKISTVIIKGAAKKEVLEDRINQLKTRIKDSASIFEKEKLQERLAKLTTGVAVIKVGGKTEVEQRERVERVKDAVGATRAALEEGIVPGGGVAFLQLIQSLEGFSSEGVSLMREVLGEPIKKLLLNAGKDEVEIKKITEEILKLGGDFGFNVDSDKIEDLPKAGVIDPAKVIRLTLENAVSVAGSILTTDCIIADKTEPKPNEQIV